jgi:hypothetical protein
MAFYRKSNIKPLTREDKQSINKAYYNNFGPDGVLYADNPHENKAAFHKVCISAACLESLLGKVFVRKCQCSQACSIRARYKKHGRAIQMDKKYSSEDCNRSPDSMKYPTELYKSGAQPES